MPIRHSTYLTSFVVGKYVKLGDFYKDIPLGFYVYQGREPIAKAAFGKTKEMMRIYEDLTGIDFPYTKYDQTIVANYSAFSAMENITATTLSDNDVFLAQYHETNALVEDIVSHELAHSWFGNLVTCENWAELWLNEGFATFMEAAYREKAYGRENYLDAVRTFSLEYFLEQVPPGQKHGLYNRLARPDDSIFDATTYQKGGAVIHTLRAEIGDAAFWRGIHNYLERHKFENVETADLQKAMEEASGQKLEWFFSQWVYAAGYPQLEITQTFNKKKKTLTLGVTQTQVADDLVPAVFILPLDVEIASGKGTKTEKIRIDKRNQSFSFKLEDELNSVTFDKNFKIPLKMIDLKSLKRVDK
jgi:aminopeptidase N